MTDKEARDRVEWLCAFTVVNNPFVHEFLMLMDKHITRKVPTMAVSVQGVKFHLYVNPDFLEGLTIEEANYVFFHECLHLALHHCTRIKGNNHHLLNISADLAVNELIPDDGVSYSRPRTVEKELMGVFVDEFRKTRPECINIEDKQSYEWYYDFLEEKAPKIKVKVRGLGKSGDEEEKGEGGGKGEEGDEEEKGKGSGKGSGEEKKEGGGKGSEGEEEEGEFTVEGLDSHEHWDGENELADDIIRSVVEHIKNSNSWGPLGSDASETIMAAQKVRIDWKALARRFMGNIAWKERETTRRKPNRRMGLAHPGYKNIQVDKMLLAVDTSGSVGSELLGQFLGVMNKAIDWVPLDVMQFDAEVTTKPQPFNRKRAKFDFKGRGGTNFQPVIDTATEGKYKGLIILTDGYAPAPTEPRGCRVMWALPKGCNSPVEWGQTVHLDKHA